MKRSAHRELAERVLGKAVHPAALDRLFEVWPEAAVSVSHGETAGGIRYTSVAIFVRATDWPAEGAIVREAWCHPSDQFDRRYGISLAFRRALRGVVIRESAWSVAEKARKVAA